MGQEHEGCATPTVDELGAGGSKRHALTAYYQSRSTPSIKECGSRRHSFGRRHLLVSRSVLKLAQGRVCFIDKEVIAIRRGLQLCSIMTQMLTTVSCLKCDTYAHIYWQIAVDYKWTSRAHCISQSIVIQSLSGQLRRLSPGSCVYSYTVVFRGRMAREYDCSP